MPGHDSFSRLLGILIWGQHDKNIDNNFRTSFKKINYILCTYICVCVCVWPLPILVEKGKCAARAGRAGRGSGLGSSSAGSRHVKRRENAWQINSCERSQIACSYCFDCFFFFLARPNLRLWCLWALFDLFLRHKLVDMYINIYAGMGILLSHHFPHISGYLSNVSFLLFAVCEK